MAPENTYFDHESLTLIIYNHYITRNFASSNDE